MYNEKNIDFVAGKIVGMIKEYRVDTMYMYIHKVVLFTTCSNSVYSNSHFINPVTLNFTPV